MSEIMVSLKNIHKSFGNNQVLKGIDLNINKGEVVVLLGPSGTGKTTLLRCINLLEIPDEGSVTIDGETVEAKKLTRKQSVQFRRNTAMVFQHFNLLKNKTVLENVTEGLVVVQKKSKEGAREIALRELRKVGMEDKLDSYPSQISGGQQQRVGIARALALNPKVLLLDEPTSALDPELVDDFLNILRDIAKTGITMVIVTHEISFARDVATKVVFMDGGSIVEQGGPKEIFDHPKEERTIGFLRLVLRNDYDYVI